MIVARTLPNGEDLPEEAFVAPRDIAGAGFDVAVQGGDPSAVQGLVDWAMANTKRRASRP